jgi:hypothetical protein
VHEADARPVGAPFPTADGRLTPPGKHCSRAGAPPFT